MLEQATTTIYLTMNDGSFRRLVPEGTPGATTRTASGKILHEICYKSVTGHIRSVSVHEDVTPTGVYKYLKVYMVNHAGQACSIKIYYGKFARTFLIRLPMVDMQSLVVLKAGKMKKEDGHWDAYLSVQQHGETVQQYKPYDQLPPLQQVSRGNATYWDDTDLMRTLLQKNAHLLRVEGSTTDAPAGHGPEDDLPF